MMLHFLHRYVWDTVVILEEGNLPHPWCPRCDMLVPWSTLNERHIATAQCARGEERKQLRLAEEELRESSKRAFQAYEKTLENATVFKYMGRVMTTVGDTKTEVSGKLQKVKKIWGWMSRHLIREGTDPKILEKFSKAVVQAVLVLGAEM